MSKVFKFRVGEKLRLIADSNAEDVTVIEAATLTQGDLYVLETELGHRFSLPRGVIERDYTWTPQDPFYSHIVDNFEAIQDNLRNQIMGAFGLPPLPELDPAPTGCP